MLPNLSPAATNVISCDGHTAIDTIRDATTLRYSHLDRERHPDK